METTLSAAEFVNAFVAVPGILEQYQLDGVTELNLILKRYTHSSVLTIWNGDKLLSAKFFLPGEI